ncbi:unnamed protein product [Caenorhabditis sp. 36 PRJEB53466]|nr:unnamed protein product [Caenorhabditis sp. 36 PRJEB53466]
MILTGNILVDPTNLESAGNPIIFKDGDSQERRALFTHWAKLMKQDGALAVMQLSHAGRQTPEHLNPTPWSASDIQLTTNVRLTAYGKPKALSTEQVKTEVVDRFVYAAKYAYECGFDGIQLHAAHGYLLSQFTSPTTNKRTDQYGGSLENRQRVIIEIFDAIRKDIPSSTGFLIGIKTNSVEFQAEGTTLEDAKEMCAAYENKGFDFVELSGGTYEKLSWTYERESTRKREAFFVEFAEQIRPVFKNTIVYLTGGFRTASAMVDAIAKNATQGIGLGRPVTAEPDLPKKILAGGIHSAVQDLLDQNDMIKTVLASGAQMQQMGRTSVQSAGGNGKEAQNRFLKAALTERVSTYDPENPKNHGLPTDSILNLYDKWGNGKFGMILTGNVLVDPTNLESAGNAIIFEEGDSAERRALFSKWAEKIKQDGALAVVQLSHGGRQTPATIEPHPWSASDVKLVGERRFTPFGKPVPLTVEQIKTHVIDRFVYAARFAYETGFDGVELHAAHGYLLAQFTSPTTNKRIDHYGGSIANRQRIILEIYDAIRAAVPASTGFIVGIKTNSVEFQEEGTTVDHAKEMCEAYENAGFDFVELSGGTYEKLAFHHLRESTRNREAFFLEFAEKIRPVFKNTVVYLTGGFRTVKAMVEAVETGATQGIGLGRPITAEPDLPKKILERSVASSIRNALDDNDFAITNLASNTQMHQMGKTTFKQAGQKPTHGISDFSDETTVERYKEALKEYTIFMKTLAAQKKPIHGVLVFEAIYQA